MAVFAKDRIEVRNLQRNKHPLVEPTEPVYQVEITGETDAQRKNREVRNQEKRVGWEKHVMKAREKGVLCCSFRWDEVEAKVRSYLFLSGSRGPAPTSAKALAPCTTHCDNQRVIYDSGRHIHNKQNCRVRKIFAVNFICSKQKKTESLEQFHADLVELASRSDCGDRESERVRDVFTAHMPNEKIAEELLAETKTPQEAYEYAIRREKGIEHSRTMKTNPFGNQTATTKQEPIHFINTRRRGSFTNNQATQRGRGNFWGRPSPRVQQKTRGQSQQQQRNQYSNTQKQCYKCGNLFGQNHLQSCPAKDEFVPNAPKGVILLKCVNQ